MSNGEVEVLSSGDNCHDQVLYYTSHSLRADDAYLQIISDRTGQPNVFAIDLTTGAQTQRTFCASGILKQYVYFGGLPYAGIGVASISAHRGDGSLYYIHGREVRKVDPSGVETVLNILPDDQMTAFTHVSWDGRRLCVPTTDERALGGKDRAIPDWNIDRRVLDEGLSSYLFIYDTETGEELCREPAPLSWITHVQFSPVTSDQLLVEYEWPVDPGIRYQWMFNMATGERIQLRDEKDGRSREDRVCHPVWTFDGKHIIYHGRFHEGPNFVGRVDPDGDDIREVEFPASYSAYGHFNISRSGLIVSDGYYHPPGEPSSHEWISLLHVDWDNAGIDWRPLCRHGALWDNQDSHPHPIFSDREDAVYFTGSHNPAGTPKRAVCRIRI